MKVKDDSKIIIREADGSERIVEHCMLFEREKDGHVRTIRNLNPVDMMFFGASMLEALHKHSLLAMFIWGMSDEVEVKQVIRKALEK